MEILTAVFDYILNDLGSTVFLPIIMFIMGLIFGMKVTDALSSGIMFGVALAGMSLVVGYMTDAISPVAEAMSENVGKTFDIVDGGWVTMSSITWSWEYAFIMFPVQIIVNLVLFAVKFTDTINCDLWNVWGKVFYCYIVYYLTGNMILGYIVAIARMVLELMFADRLQPTIYKRTGVPGMTCSHFLMSFGSVVYPIELLLRKIPALEAQTFDAVWLKSKIGIFAENHVMGAILGLIFGLVGGYSIADALILAIECAAAMTLMPMVTKLFMNALEPITDAATEFMKKHASGREVFVGLDCPVLLGDAEIWVTCIIAVPFYLIWAMVLPFNSMLPFAGIVNYGMTLALFYACKGNLIRMILEACLIGVPVFLFAGNQIAPVISELALANGFIESGMVSNSGIDAPLFTYAFTYCWTGDITAIICAIYWAFGCFLYLRDLDKQNKEMKAEAAAA